MTLDHLRSLQLKKLKNGFGLGALILFSVFIFGCQPVETDNTNASKTPDITPSPKQNLTEFESELKSMRIADFDYVFVLKRKDGGVFNSEDKAFVRANKHFAANRFSFIEDEKTLFVGSNYEFSPENIEALKERFDFQNFSKSPEEIEKIKQRRKEEREEREKAIQESKPDNSSGNTDNSSGNSAKEE